MSPSEINERLREAFQYDEYRYQRENGIRITEPYRAEGLHKILYKCPHCKAESKMGSEGAEIFCRECGKRWELGEDGVLTDIVAKASETEQRLSAISARLHALAARKKKNGDN